MQDVADIQEMRLRQVENVLSAIFDGQTKMASSMQAQAKELGLVRSRMDGLEQRMGGLEQRMGGLDQRMDGLDQRMDGLDQRVSSVELRLESVEARLESLETQSARMLELLTLALDDLAFIKEILTPKK